MLGKHLPWVCHSWYLFSYTGSHKDHNVKLIKKAISQVKAEYLEVISQVGDAQNTMGKMKEGFLRLIKENNDRHSREKNTITR
jgi:hypothetical protein